LEAWFDEQSRQVVRHPIAVPALKKIDCRPAKKTRDPLLAEPKSRSKLCENTYRDIAHKLEDEKPDFWEQFANTTTIEKDALEIETD
jgi:hypothetical protein